MAEVTVVARARARPGQEADLEQALKAVVGLTRREVGCRYYALHRGLEDRSAFVMIERWVSKEAMDRHMATPHVQALLQKVPDLVAVPPEISVFEPIPAGTRRHHYHSPWRRGLYSGALVVSVLLMGTAGFHLIEGSSYLDAFYLTSMIATAQGPATVPVAPAGKLFAALMAFISIGMVVAALGFLFGPFFGFLWRIGHERWEKGERDR